MLKSIEIKGFRGFGENRVLNLAVPDGINKGSGLTTLVGANNSGKTSIIECIKYYRFDPDNISFSTGKRNIKTNKRVKITYTDIKNESYTIKTLEGKGSQVESNRENISDNTKIPYILPSRRHVNYAFHGNANSISHRWDYLNNEYMNSRTRKPTIDNFQERIFKWSNNKKEFDKILYKIIDRELEWYIDLNDDNSYYLAFSVGGKVSHTSEGLGDGIWSIFTIVDALYDSKEGSIIVIDEPELSLHPQYQRKIMNLFLEYSTDRQIIISTHSPYFISWDALMNGGEIIRVYKDENLDIDFRSLGSEDREFIKKILRNQENPHILGLEARELFFLEDNIIVVEGQEDVIALSKIMDELNISIDASFFGWGSGGANRIQGVLSILKNLGYKKVTAIYDGDMQKEYEVCKNQFPEYNVLILWKDDIRDKNSKPKKEKEGIVTSSFKLKEEEKKKTINFLSGIKKYFES